MIPAEIGKVAVDRLALEKHHLIELGHPTLELHPPLPNPCAEALTPQCGCSVELRP